MTGSFLPRIAAILNRHQDELCSSHYTRSDPSPTRHCLLGWMAHDADISLPPSRYNTHVVGMKGTRRFAGELQREYGLTLAQLKQLQLTNDEAKDIQDLTQRVSRLAEQWSEPAKIAA